MSNRYYLAVRVGPPGALRSVLVDVTDSPLELRRELLLPQRSSPARLVGLALLSAAAGCAATTIVLGVQALVLG